MFNLSETVRNADSGLVLPQTSSPFSIENLPEAQTSSKQDLNQTLSALGEDTLLMPSENSAAFAAALADAFQTPQAADAVETETAYLDLPEAQALRAEEITVHTPSAAPKWLGGLAGLGLLGALGAAGGGSGGGSSDSAAKPSAPVAETVRPANVSVAAPAQSATAAADVKTTSAQPSEKAVQTVRPVETPVQNTEKPSEKAEAVAQPVVKQAVEKAAAPSMAVAEEAAPQPTPVVEEQAVVAEPKAAEMVQEEMAPVVQTIEAPEVVVEETQTAHTALPAEEALTVTEVHEEIKVEVAVVEVETVALEVTEEPTPDVAETVVDAAETVEVTEVAETEHSVAAELPVATETLAETEVSVVEAVAVSATEEETVAEVAVETVIAAAEVVEISEAVDSMAAELPLENETLAADEDVLEVEEVSVPVVAEATAETTIEAVAETVEVIEIVETADSVVAELPEAVSVSVVAETVVEASVATAEVEISETTDSMAADVLEVEEVSMPVVAEATAETAVETEVAAAEVIEIAETADSVATELPVEAETVAATSVIEAAIEPEVAATVVAETPVQALETVENVAVLASEQSEPVEELPQVATYAAVVEAVVEETAAQPVAEIQLRTAQWEEPVSDVALETPAVQNVAVDSLADAGASVFAAVVPETLPQAAENAKPYVVGMHETYGKFIDAAQFGTDMSGETDSLAAIQTALQAAHEEGAMLYLSGKLYVSDQIKIDQNLSNVKGLFGDGMGATQIRFDKPQMGVHNPNTNEDDVRAFAGVLVDGVSGTTIADLSVAYTGEFYRKGLSYFGKVNGIQVNDADNTLITKVEVSGANRAGVAFTSTAALSKDPNGNGKTFKARVAAGEVDETYEGLPLGENNRIEHSHLHHNRVAGALVSYQKDFMAADNLLERNGHEADGGTGYGIATMAGSYNFGVTFSGNTTDHNYRKGLDVHDGTDIVIQNNVLNGDRLYGIAVYNRQFAMDKVTISGNAIQQDAHFRLAEDDDLGSRYHGYSGIQLMTNTQFRDLHTADNAMYSITGNTISGLAVYNNAQQTYGIEFRNHEQKINYTVDISGNHLSGDSARYIIGILNDTRTPKTRDLGPGSGTINIVGNTAEIGEIIDRSVPIYVEEKNFIETLRGHVSVSENNITIGKSNGYVEAVQLLGNAETYTVSGNTFNLGGTVDRSIVNIVAKTAGEPTATISDNVFHTDLKLIRGNWLQVKDAAYISLDNEHNGKQVEMKSNMAAEKAAELVAQHEAAEAAELAQTWQADGSRSSFEGILTEGNTAQAGIGAWEFAQAEVYAYDANETFTVDTAAGAAYL